MCIGEEKICDDKLDCPNGADEGPGCDNIECDRYGLSVRSVFCINWHSAVDIRTGGKLGDCLGYMTLFKVFYTMKQ